jgi:hypothetical protein
MEAETTNGIIKYIRKEEPNDYPKVTSDSACVAVWSGTSHCLRMGPSYVGGIICTPRNSGFAEQDGECRDVGTVGDSSE